MASKMKILHFADLHVGMENYGKLDPRTGINRRVLDFLHRFDDGTPLEETLWALDDLAASGGVIAMYLSHYGMPEVAQAPDDSSAWAYWEAHLDSQMVKADSIRSAGVAVHYEYWPEGRTPNGEGGHIFPWIDDNDGSGHDPPPEGEKNPGSVTVFDAETREVLSVAEVPNFARFIAFLP